MDSIQGAVLSVKLRHLDKWTAARQANAARYNELFADVPAITTPTVKSGNTHIYHQYIIRTPRRDELAAHLKNKEIACGIYYPLCLHQQPCFKDLGYSGGDLPESERAAEQVLALPICPELSPEQVNFVADVIKGFLA